MAKKLKLVVSAHKLGASTPTSKKAGCKLLVRKTDTKVSIGN
jgi:hypothetical protein